jgi:hypothetical protein
MQSHLDWVRIGAFGLLIFYHVGMLYVSWGFHIKSAHRVTALEPLMLVLNPWRLALLFLVSGVATRFMLRKSALGSLLRARSARLLIPLATGRSHRPARHTASATATSATVVFSALHIIGMVMLRKLVMALAGGVYDFRFSAVTLLYEFRKDIVTCLLIGGALWLIASRRENPRSQTAVTAAPVSGTASPPAVWLRDGTTRIRLEPRDVLWISSAGNYVEYSLADGSSHLIRGTLAAAEAEFGRFNLVRVHRTRLANLNRVTSVEFKPSGDFDLTFDTGKTVQGSRRYKTTVESLDRSTASA